MSDIMAGCGGSLDIRVCSPAACGRSACPDFDISRFLVDGGLTSRSGKSFLTDGLPGLIALVRALRLHDHLLGS